MADFFDVNLLKAVLRMATPLIFAAMGGLLCERSGIMNIGLEGMMLTGAFVGVLGTYYLHNPWWGLALRHSGRRRGWVDPRVLEHLACVPIRSSPAPPSICWRPASRSFSVSESGIRPAERHKSKRCQP